MKSVALLKFAVRARSAPVLNGNLYSNFERISTTGFKRAASGGAKPMAVNKQSVEDILTQQLDPHILKVEDTSGGCGTSFSVFVVSEKFEGKPLLQRHRLVNEALKNELKTIHALEMKTLTPSQWEGQNTGG